MGLVSLEMTQIAELGTRVGMHGSVRSDEAMVDDVFEIIVGVVALIAQVAR